MAEYEDGAAGQVESDPYCMGKSFQAKNVKEMNQKMGYHNMSDLANNKKAPVEMMGEKMNKQLSPSLPGDDDYDYDKNR
jgi:hypothetical protein